MQPQLQRHASFQVAGPSARTTIHDEHDPAAARIVGLWVRFFDERFYESTCHRTADRRLYGVYSSYDAKARNVFDVTTGIAVSGGPSAVRIEDGDYLVFSGQGRMPQTVRDIWKTISRYFEEHPEIERLYRSDFEAYSGPEHVSIHIGVSLD